MAPGLARSISSARRAAGVHVNYQETKLHFHDGLLKLKDYPKEMGGSGISVPEGDVLEAVG